MIYGLQVLIITNPHAPIQLAQVDSAVPQL